MVKAFQKLPQVTPRVSFDVKARAAALSGDPAAAFTFVRDQIANEVYPGVLRGASGTLSAQAGNDLDKALLLGALLTEQHRQVRYAQCTLDDRWARERIRTIFATPPAAQPDNVDQALKPLLIGEGIPEARAIEILDARKAVREALHQAVIETAEADLAIVRDALKKANITPKPVSIEATLLAEARTHYWVQAEDAGRWQDLDPTFPTMKVGQTVCAADHTYGVLPPQLHQYVTVRVINEYLEGEQLRRTGVLEQRIPVADLHGQSILFINFPEPSSSLTSGSIATTRTFAPVLVVGELFASGEAFHIGSEAASGPGGLFGQAAGTSSPRLAGQWLEFDLTAPGRKFTVSRAVVDAVNPKERAAGTISALPDLSLVTAQLLQPLVIAVSTGRLDLSQVLARAFAGVDAEVIGRLFAATAQASPPAQVFGDLAAVEDRSLAARALAFALAADGTLSRSWTAAYPHARAFRDQPFIVIANATFRPSADGTTLGAEFSIDLRHNVVRVVPESSEWSDQSFWLNVHHGLVDGALERHLPNYLVLRGGGAEPPPGALTALSTSTLFEMARAQGTGQRAAAGRQADRTLREEFADAGGHRLAAELSDDIAVVLPARTVRFKEEDRLGMWSVNLATGHLVALLDTGLRQDTTERSIMEEHKKVLSWWKKCLKLEGREHQLCRELEGRLIHLGQKATEYRNAIPWIEWKTVASFPFNPLL